MCCYLQYTVFENRSNGQMIYYIWQNNLYAILHFYIKLMCNSDYTCQ
jgi:hypothetical protein